MKISTLATALICFFCPPVGEAQSTGSPDSVWEIISDISSVEKTTNLKLAESYDLYALKNYDSLFSRLLAAPRRFNQTEDQQIIMSLPLANGRLERFKVLYAPVMATPLAAKYPDIRSYTLIGIDKAYLRAKIDFGPHGFHAMIIDPISGTTFVNPYNLESSVYYVFNKKDYPSPEIPFRCEFQDILPLSGNKKSLAGDCELREYRLALACTGEYATFHGGTVALALAAMNVSMNRVNGIFEADAGITMTLIANNDQIIYLNGATDPYSNGNGGAMLGQNQTNCDNVIGSANYDIGHVFSTGGGGVAVLRSPCNSSHKAKGVTGLSSPVGDPFDVDYVSHEMGHQYGGYHTQNNNCNRTNAHAYEPGSASTIMGYAGICSPNVQNNSDPYFHATSIGSFADFVTNGSTGGSCDNVLSTANNQPIADAGLDYTIPISTPFTLTGIGTDADGDTLTYCWEQFDNQISTQPPSPTSTGGPSFRSLLPKLSPSRDFPDMGVGNTWEVLPSVSRTMNFRLTVRDYNNTHGYGCTDEDDMQVTTSANAGPFVLTKPNGGEVWAAGIDTVQWNVANTDIAPVNCSHVDIYLSLDGGLNYDMPLALNVPNDGFELVNVPTGILGNTDAKIRIQAVGNIFFDVSDNTFEINSVLLNCVTYTSLDVPVSIPTSPATVFSDLTISDTDTIISLKILNVEGTHTHVSDLIFTLVNNTGDEIALLGGECGSQDDFDMDFSDNGDPVSCPLDQSLEYKSTALLSSNFGNPANGLWRLKIEDTENQDGGELTSWEIEICYESDCPNTLVFDTGTIPSGDYFASQSITASVPADASSVIWMRSPELNFEGGFEVPSGAEFLIENGDCP